MVKVQGERVDDDSVLNLSDAQGQVLLNMETLWQQAYPSECVIVIVQQAFMAPQLHG